METARQGKAISIRFPVDVLDALRASAREHERSFNGEVIWALRDYIRRSQTTTNHDQGETTT